MIFIVSWCYGGLAVVVFILFWQGSYPPLVAPPGINRNASPTFWGRRNGVKPKGLFALEKCYDARNASHGRSCEKVEMILVDF